MEVAHVGKSVRFFVQDNEAPSRKSKQDQKAEKATVASVRSNPKLGCVSQDVKLPEQTVGFTDVRRSILKDSGKSSPRAHHDLKCTTTAKDGSTFGTNWDHL